METHKNYVTGWHDILWMVTYYVGIA